MDSLYAPQPEEPPSPEPDPSSAPSSEEMVTETWSNGVAEDGVPSPPQTAQILGSLLASLDRQREDHSPSWSPHEPLAEDLASTLEALDPEIGGSMLEQMVHVERTLSADNADFLSGTQLDQPGVPGVYTIWGASTVGDTEITVTLGGRRIVDAAIVTLRANSEIREQEDTFYQMVSRTGGRPVININVVTAAVVRIRVKFLPAQNT